jgi:glycosyltransferase involved in cell wall biosynthesis
VKALRIALLHYSAPPIVGGVESVLAHQARLMADAGHDVRILAARGGQTDPRISFVPIPLADSRHERVLRVKAQLDQGVVTNEFAPLRGELEHELEQALTAVDVLIAHNVCSLNKNLALTAALHTLFNRQSPIANPRLILWHHDLAWTTPRYLDELHDGYPWDLLREDWPGATHVVVSELRRDELAAVTKIPADSIVVIPSGVDLARFHKLESQTQSIVVSLRLAEADLILLLPVRITPRKNIELALRTLAVVRRDFPCARLIVTGPLGAHNGNNAGYLDQLLSLRSQLSLDNAAHFLAELTEDFLPDEVIADFYRLADALFLPSREEGFGIPMLEAAFSHLPIFCADLAPLRALGQADAIYFSPDEDPNRVAGLIVERMRGNAVFQSAARARANYTWEHIYAQRIAPLLTSA